MTSPSVTLERPAVATAGDRGGGRRNPVSATLVTVTLGALTLRLLRLDHQSLWMDEATQWLVDSARTPAQAWHVATGGLDRNLPVYPLYHAVMWAWMHLTPRSVWWFRLPSALASASVVPAVWCIAGRVAPRARTIAAVLAAMSPLAVYYGQEARMYALACALAAWSVHAWLRVCEEPSRRRWTAYVVLRALAFYAHPYTAALTVPELVSAWRGHEASPTMSRRSLGTAVAALSAAALPWGVLAAGLPATAAGFAKPLSPVDLGYAGFALLYGFSLGPSVTSLHTGFDVVAAVPAIAVSAVPVVVIVVSWVRRGSERGLLGGYLLACACGAAAASVTTHATFNVRYVIAALPVVCVVAADGISAISRRPWRVAVAGGLLALMGWSLVSWWTDPTYAKDDYRDAARFVQQRAHPGDLVVLLAAPWPFDIYTHSQYPVTNLYTGGHLDADAWARVQHTGLPRGTVFVVRARPWEVDPVGSVRRWLLAQGQVCAHTSVPDIEVYQLAVATPCPLAASPGT